MPTPVPDGGESALHGDSEAAYISSIIPAAAACLRHLHNREAIFHCDRCWTNAQKGEGYRKYYFLTTLCEKNNTTMQDMAS